MRKTPSYLKGLAETRARAAGDLARLQALMEGLDRKIEQVRDELNACDLLIRKFDARLNPNEISPITATKGKYSRYGALKATILQLLEDAYPHALDTLTLANLVEGEFGLDLPTQKAKSRWLHNSLSRGLKKMVVQGTVERLHDPSIAGAETGRWRLKKEGEESLFVGISAE